MRSALLSSLLQTGFNVLLYIVLIRLLPVEQMRTWVLYVTVTAFADMARQGFVYNATVRFWAANPEHRGQIAGASLMLSLMASGLAGCAVLALSFPLSRLWGAPELPGLAACYLPFAMAFGLLRWLEMLQIASENFKAQVWSGGIFGGGLLAGVACLAFGGPITLFEVVQIQTVVAVVAALFLIKKYGWPQKMVFWDLVWMRELVRFGRVSAGTSLFSMLFNKADVLLLGALLPGPAVVLYDAASRLYNYLDLPLNAISQVYYPKLSRAFGQQNRAEATQLFQSAVGQLLAVMAPLIVCFLVGAPLLIRLFCGEKYLAAAPLLQILVLATFAKPWGRVGGIMLDASGQPLANFVLLVLSAAVTIGLNFTFITLFGVWGAAVASCLSLWITVVLGQCWLHRQLPVNQSAIFQETRDALSGGRLFKKLIFSN